MPVSTKKDVYIAKSMGDLNKMAELPDKFKNTNAKLLVKTAEKMLKEAEHSDMLTDEERAYVLYMKYFNVVTFLKKTADYKKQKKYFDDLLGSKNLMKAIDKAEELATSLKQRYELLEAEAVANKLASLDRKEVVEDAGNKTQDKEPETQEVADKPSVKTAPTEAPTAAAGSLSCTQMFHLLQDRDTQIIIMDVRPIGDYQESRIEHNNIINVPSETLPPGTTVTYIEKALPMDSLSLWKQRGNIDHIVLLDWNTEFDRVKIGSPLQTLKDALYKYDSSMIIKSEPLILDGGYERWVLHYPTFCINPNLERVSRPAVQSTQDSLMDFDYPDFDEMVKPVEPVRNIDSSRFHDNQMNGFVTNDLGQKGPSWVQPMIDRSTKPTVDRSTKVNVTRIDVNGAKSNNSLYPDVRAISSQPSANQKPAQGVGTNQNQASTIPANQSRDRSNFNTADTGALVKDRKIDSSASLSKVSSDLSKELVDLERLKREKQLELDRMQDDHERIKRDSVAKMEKMRQEETRLNELEELRRKQQQDVADLLRMKRNIQQNMQDEKLETDKVKKREEEEQLKRQKELQVISREEAEKKRRQEEVNRLRMERKLKEEGEKEKEKERQQKELQDAQERARLEEEKRQLDLTAAEERADLIRKAEADKKSQEEEDIAREKAAIDERLQRERDLQARLDKERQAAFEEKRRIQAEIDRKEREKQDAVRAEKDRLEKERLEREKVERDEKDRKRAEEAKHVADEKLRLLNVESRTKPKIVPSPNLSVGWEKQLDPRTNRYFYINHNDNTTHWEPPEHLVKSPVGTKPGDSYTARLKDEPRETTRGGSRGLSRSNSSPNIAQMVEDESKWKKPMPSVDRASKPRKQEIVQPIQMPAKRRDLNPVYGNVGRALTGLRNLGNTCYMNSTIQCLNNTSPLVTYLLTNMYLYDINKENILGDGGEVADDFAFVVKALWTGQYRFIAPRDFKHVVGKYQPMFAGFDQQDSQEFLTFLLDGLHEGLNKVKTRPKIPEQDNDRLPDFAAAELAWKNHKLQNESIIVELFQGQLKSTLQCLTCRKQSVNFQAFMFLSLPIPSSSRCSLEDCLNQFSCPEKMSGSSRWHCPQCKCLRDSVKKIDVWKLPRILLIALNRFVYEGQWRTKINAHVDFPTRGMDLSEFVKGPKSKPYKLYAVSNHFGTLDGGHYTACCKNPCTQKWNKFDDHEVYDVSESSIKTSAAYVLYYTSVELPPPEFKPTFQ